MNLADELEALRRVIADNDPNEPIADNGMTVWDGVRHTASYLFPRIIAALRATEPAQDCDADRAFELWFFRDIVDDQRSKLIALMLGGAVAKEATNHGTQRLCLKYILKALRAQGRAEAAAEIVAWLRVNAACCEYPDDAIQNQLADAIEAREYLKQA